MSPLLEEILREARARGASDVHLTADRPPALRVCGRIEFAPRDPLESEALRGALQSLLSPDQLDRYARERSLEFTFYREEMGFFRFAIYSHLGRMEASIRIGHDGAPSLAELGLPPILLELVRRPHGLVLITGPTGVGKTTSLNALIARLNAEDRKKIITVEDPVEYVHRPGRSLLIQREIGMDARSFSDAMRQALRQDPDVICLGEMRDLDTIAAALTAAETGHLMLSTIHTTGAAGTVTRIIDVFPPHQQPQIRLQLAMTLQAILSQRLLPKADGSGLLLVYELLIMTDAARHMIREGKAHQLTNVVQMGGSLGMKSMDRMVRDAWLAGEVTYDTALSAISNPRLLERR